MLLAKNISFKRDDKIILDNINLTLTSKKIIYLTGRNGAGKTTLLKILTNVLKPKSGEIFWNGKNIKKDPFNFYKNSTFIMDQQTSSKSLKVIENIIFWQELFNSDRNSKEIDSLLGLLLLKEYKDMYVNNLSYGEIKKLELARLIIEQKKFWLLDEPFVGLDNKSIHLIVETIKNHADLGGMVIFTSHLDPQIDNLEKLNLEDNANI